MELNAVTRSVGDIFSVSKKYRVPRFQREYSWGSDEIQEFWDDVIQQISVRTKRVKHTEYFVGCIVLVGEDSKADYYIVDGQQRLTTITIFLRAIINRLDELGDKVAAKALYKNVIEGTDDDGKPYFKLINETPKPYFQNEIQGLEHAGIKKAQNDEERLLSDAYGFFLKKLGSISFGTLSPLESVKAIRTQVLSYLKFILVTAKSEDDAYTIFETLNARGISLTSVDLIKNWIFKNYKDTHPNDNAKHIWSEIRSTIQSLSDIETFFRHYWNSKYSFASNDRLYKSFNDFRKSGEISSAKDFLKELKEASIRYKKIADPSLKDWPSQNEKMVGRYLELLNQYKVTQVRPFLLSLLECRSNKLIKEVEFVRVVRNLENFHFIFSNVCQSRASGIEGTYTRAAKNLYAAKGDREKIREVLKKLNTYLIDKRPKPQIILESVAEMSFAKGNDLNKKTIQTIFMKVEHHLQVTSELNMQNFSLEHIHDQSNATPWIGKVGNLLPLDGSLNNGIKEGSSFKNKKNVYEKSSLKTVEKFLEMNEQDEWNDNNVGNWESFVVNQLDDATKIIAI